MDIFHTGNETKYSRAAVIKKNEFDIACYQKLIKFKKSPRALRPMYNSTPSDFIEFSSVLYRTAAEGIQVNNDKNIL